VQRHQMFEEEKTRSAAREAYQIDRNIKQKSAAMGICVSRSRRREETGRLEIIGTGKKIRKGEGRATGRFLQWGLHPDLREEDNLGGGVKAKKKPTTEGSTA